jgi:hypothetical protein
LPCHRPANKYDFGVLVPFMSRPIGMRVFTARGIVIGLVCLCFDIFKQHRSFHKNLCGA